MVESPTVRTFIYVIEKCNIMLQPPYIGEKNIYMFWEVASF